MMKKLATTALAAVMALTGVSFSAFTATAAPVVPLVQSGDNANLIQVQGDGRWSRRDGNFNERQILRRNWQGRNWDGGRRDRNFRSSGFYERGGHGWYNGHRGYREYRRGYRRHGDWWFPAGAFVAGAIIGGALSNPGPTYYEPAPIRRVYRSGNYGQAHVQWCYNRYRSYDARSNTFQPYNGPRQQCYSPYS